MYSDYVHILICFHFQDKSSGKSLKTISRVSQDMGSVVDTISPVIKKEKETPKQVKPEAKVTETKDESSAKLPVKRRETRSTPSNTPAKKRK